MPQPVGSPGEKRSGEQSQTSWADYQKVVRTNEIVSSLHSTSLTLANLYSGICTFFERAWHKVVSVPDPKPTSVWITFSIVSSYTGSNIRGRD